MATAKKSKLINKLKKKSKGAWKRSKKVEAKAKGRQLPGGLENAVAKLVDYKFDEDKNHNPYFQLIGTVVEPEEYKGMRCVISHFIAESQTKTVEDKLDGLSNDLQLFGVETTGLDIGEIPEAIEALVEEGPFFLFRTWKPDEDRQAMVFLGGLAEDFEDEETDEEEEVEEEDTEDEDEEEIDDEEEEVEEEEVEEEEEEEDGDEGEEEEEEEEEDSEEEDDDSEDEEEEDEVDWTPEKEEIYSYKATPKGKAQECEVRTVSAKNRTVTLKRISDEKVFKAVSWDKLEGE